MKTRTFSITITVSTDLSVGDEPNTASIAKAIAAYNDSRSWQEPKLSWVLNGEIR